MSIIYKYLTIQISKYFAIVLATVVSIYVVVDFFERIDDFMEVGLPLSKALTFFFFQTPFIIAQIIPLGILLAVMIVFGLMARNNEIVALQSSGMHVFYLLKPVLVIGLVSTILLFCFSEIVVPIAMDRANQIWLREVRKEKAVISQGKNIWIKGNRSITNIKYYNPKVTTIFGITFYRFDKDFRLLKRIDAQKGVYKKDNWLLFNVVEQNLNQEDGSYNIKFHKSRSEAFDFLPENLKRVIKKSEEMGFKELIAYIKKVETEGYDATIYKVDLYAKAAFPLVCFIMCMVGAGIAFKGKDKKSLAVSIAYGIGIASLYWIFFSFCISLGHGEKLPPFIAAWAANLVFLCWGGVILLKTE